MGEILQPASRHPFAWFCWVRLRLQRYQAKLELNSLYGKFVSTKRHHDHRSPSISKIRRRATGDIL